MEFVTNFSNFHVQFIIIHTVFYFLYDTVKQLNSLTILHDSHRISTIKFELDKS